MTRSIDLFDTADVSTYACPAPGQTIIPRTSQQLFQVWIKSNVQGSSTNTLSFALTDDLDKANQAGTTPHCAVPEQYVVLLAVCTVYGNIQKSLGHRLGLVPGTSIARRFCSCTPHELVQRDVP